MATTEGSEDSEQATEEGSDNTTDQADAVMSEGNSETEDGGDESLSSEELYYASMSETADQPTDEDATGLDTSEDTTSDEGYAYLEDAIA
jgi:hypothetical protein